MSNAIIEASRKHPKPAEKKFTYGTAGVSTSFSFRMMNRVLMMVVMIVPHEGVSLVVSRPRIIHSGS